jgi:hypothetical protein
LETKIASANLPRQNGVIRLNDLKDISLIGTPMRMALMTV